jgi:hypothetical protein
MPPPLPNSPVGPRWMTWVLGPELFWLLVYVAMHVVAGRNQPPTEQGSAALEVWWWLLAFVAVPLTFACFAVPGAGRWWLLLRVDLVAIVGLGLAAGRVTTAIDYGDSRNSGVPMGWVMSVGFGLVMLFASNVVAALVLWLRRK